MQYSFKKSIFKGLVGFVLAFLGFTLEGVLSQDPHWAQMTVGSVLVGALAFLRNVAKVRFGARMP